MHYILGMGNQQERQAHSVRMKVASEVGGGVVRCIPCCWSVREEKSDAEVTAGLDKWVLVNC